MHSLFWHTSIIQNRQIRGMFFWCTPPACQQKYEAARCTMKQSISGFIFSCLWRKHCAVFTSQAKDSYHARIAFHRWCKMAEETGSLELKTMARTNKLDGILSLVKRQKKWYRRWDLNPHVLGTPDFESSASAIPPLRHILVAGPGLEPGTCGL